MQAHTYSLQAAHRARYFDVLRERGAAAIIPTHTTKTRSNDTEYRFRPDSDFWYLSGFAEPESYLVMLPAREPDQEDRTILFLRARDPLLETWHGRRLGIDAAPDTLGIDEAWDEADFWTSLPELLRGYGKLVWSVGAEPERDRRFLDVVQGLRNRARGKVLPPTEILDPRDLLHELRLCKDEQEIECMRRAAAITAEAHKEAMRECAPGVGEQEIDALLEYTFRRRGGEGCAYTNIVAGGANACILHYVENNRPLVDGDLLLIDAGSEWQHYASDVTRTFPVNGSYTPDQKALYEVVLAAQVAAVEAVQPGVPFHKIHETALACLCQGMLDLGILMGSLEEVLESGAYQPYYMHGTSHWLGLDVHDCGSNTTPEGESRELRPGMVLTVEPGLYIEADSEAPERFWGMGIRIEDDVLVTSEGHEVLTAAIPKSLAAVEAACAAPHHA